MHYSCEYRWALALLDEFEALNLKMTFRQWLEAARELAERKGTK